MDWVGMTAHASSSEVCTRPLPNASPSTRWVNSHPPTVFEVGKQALMGPDIHAAEPFHTGVTDNQMLSKKKNADKIAPCSERMAAVRSFLRSYAPPTLEVRHSSTSCAHMHDTVTLALPALLLAAHTRSLAEHLCELL